MRWISRIARLCAVAFACSAMAPASGFARDRKLEADRGAIQAQGPGVIPDTRAIRGFVPPSRFDEADEIAALEAIRVALTEVGDGGSYAWYRENGNLNGVVNPTSSFKDRNGRICRHIVLILSAGPQTGRVEGIACRGPDGRWLLEG